MPEADVAYLSQALLTLEVFSAPNIGTFYRKPAPARIDPETNQIHPPGFRTEFIPFSQTHVDEFEQFLQELHDLSADEAKTLAANISARAAGLLYKNKEVELPGAGLLRLKPGGTILYEPSAERGPDDSNYGLTPAVLQAPVERPEKEEATKDAPSPVRKGVDKKAAAEYSLLVGVAVILFGALISIFFFQQEIIDALSGTKPKLKKESEQMWEKMIANAEADSLATRNDTAVAPAVDSLAKDANDTLARASQLSQNDGAAAESAHATTYHIIAAAEPARRPAIRAAEAWEKKGYATRVIPNQQRTRFRVSIFSAESEAEALRQFKLLRVQETVDENAWILELEGGVPNE